VETTQWEAITRSLSPTFAAWTSTQLFHDWFDPIEVGVRDRCGALSRHDRSLSLRRRFAATYAARQRPRTELTVFRQASAATARPPAAIADGNVRRWRSEFPRARLTTADGKTSEWKSKTLPAYQRRTRAADALIAAPICPAPNTRRVRRALARCSAARRQGHGEPGVRKVQATGSLE